MSNIEAGDRTHRLPQYRNFVREVKNIVLSGSRCVRVALNSRQQAVHEEETKKAARQRQAPPRSREHGLNKNLSKEHAAALTAAGVTADAIGALKAIIAKAGGPSVPPADTNSDGNREGGKKTLAELRAMQRDRRYWCPVPPLSAASPTTSS